MALHLNSVYNTDINLPWRNELSQISTAYNPNKPRTKGNCDYSPIVQYMVENCVTMSIPKMAVALREKKSRLDWAWKLAMRSSKIKQEVARRKTEAKIQEVDTVLNTYIGKKLTKVNVGKFQRLTVVKANLEAALAKASVNG